MEVIMRYSSHWWSAGYCLSAALLLALGTFATAITAAAQDISDVQTPKSPLVLKSQGSFYVGGEEVTQTAVENGGVAGHIMINQMYVRFMVPQGGTKVPVVLTHGGGLSGKSYETTPDGRMGWDEYFARQGHPVYIPDQVGRARSSFNPATYNNVRAGVVPPASQANISRTTAERAWAMFRMGPVLGTPFPDTQYPVDAFDQFGNQGTADLTANLPSPNPTIKALSDLATKLNGAVLLGHSQSFFLTLSAALLNPTVIRGLVLIETVGCANSAAYTDAQIATLATMPILVEFGDHLDSPDPGAAGYGPAFVACNAFIARINAASGNAQMLHPPALGIHGNTHMIMQDKNNLQIADLILKWIDENVGKKKVVAKN
jgi:pimeloyl-ACP methyl ester carboxylesterase